MKEHPLSTTTRTARSRNTRKSSTTRPRTSKTVESKSPSTRRLKAVPDNAADARHGHIQEFIENLPDKFLQCREMGHNWGPYTAFRYKDGGFQRTLICSRCKMRKVQDLTSRGMLTGSTTYLPPDGYRIKGLGQLAGEERGLLRMESVGRVIKKAGKSKPIERTEKRRKRA